jgi:hypothetical protein
MPGVLENEASEGEAVHSGGYPLVSIRHLAYVNFGRFRTNCGAAGDLCKNVQGDKGPDLCSIINCHVQPGSRDCQQKRSGHRSGVLNQFHSGSEAYKRSSVGCFTLIGNEGNYARLVPRTARYRELVSYRVEPVRSFWSSR